MATGLFIAGLNSDLLAPTRLRRGRAEGLTGNAELKPENATGLTSYFNGVSVAGALFKANISVYHYDIRFSFSPVIPSCDTPGRATLGRRSP